MIEKVKLEYNGKIVTGRKITVSSTLPTSVKKVWSKIQDIETLRYIAHPYAQFNPVGQIPSTWKEGDRYVFKTRMHRLIPIGKHTIKIKRIDQTKGEIVSNEFNKFVRVWNHEIIMKENTRLTTNYVDIVYVYAGILTPLIAWWSTQFYKHRQRKWEQIATKL